MEDKKLRILLQENQNIRAEAGIIANTLHNCAFAFIGSFALFIGGVTAFYDSTPHINELQLKMLAFSISQIEFFTAMYAAQLTADILSKAIYMGYLEKQINTIVNENLIFWEHEIALRNHQKGALFFTETVLIIFYLLVFIFLMGFSFKGKDSHWHFGVQLLELIIMAISITVLLRDRTKVEEKISNIIVRQPRK